MYPTQILITKNFNKSCYYRKTLYTSGYTKNLHTELLSPEDQRLPNILKGERGVRYLVVGEISPVGLHYISEHVTSISPSINSPLIA